MRSRIAAALFAATILASSADAAILLFEGQGAANNSTAARFSFLLDTAAPSPFITNSTRRQFPLDVTFTLANGTSATVRTGANFTFQTGNNGNPTNEQGILNITFISNRALPFSQFAVYNEFFATGSPNAPVFRTGRFDVSTNPNNSPDNYVVTVSAIPEPATWAMMIGGFGLVGGAMRRRATSVRFA